jgi:YVTN family beta-propeller protein
MRWLAALMPIAAAAHAQSASPTLLVLEKAARSLAIVDPGRLEILARVDAGEDPHEVVASEDGRFAYVSNYGAFSTPGHTLSVVDPAARKALPAVDLGALRAPHGLELVAGKVYFTAEGSKAIGRYDPATRQIDWALGIGQDRTHMLVVTRDLDRIFTSNVNSDTVTILERAKGSDVSGWTMIHLPVGKGPEGFDVSPDGRELWAANSHDGTVSVVDVNAKKVLQTLPLGTKRANRLKFTPDGRKVLVSGLGNGDLLVLDAESRRELKRLNLGRGAAGILVAPDGARAYVAVSPDDSVAVVDLETLSVAGRVATGKGPDGMAWAMASAPASAAPADTVRLFNGRDLGGWSAFLADPKVRMEDVWSVRDGILVGRGEPLGFLQTTAEYTSFKLLVEWRWPEGAAARLGKTPNSGVLLRVNGEAKAIPRAYEAQLQSGSAGDLYGFWGMPLEGDPARRREARGHELLGDMVGFTKAEAAEKPEGQWNVYEIVVDGPSILVHVNGKKVNEAHGAAVLQGRIGLQSEGGEIHFRKVELTPVGR